MAHKPEGGRARHQQHLRLAGPITPRYGGRVVAGGEPRRAVIGEFDADMLFFGEYPDWAAFQAMIAAPE